MEGVRFKAPSGSSRTYTTRVATTYVVPHRPPEVMTPDRMCFARDPGAALAAPDPARRVCALLRCVLTSESLACESDEQRLIRSITERIDAAGRDGTRLFRVARDVHSLLDGSGRRGAETPQMSRASQKMNGGQLSATRSCRVAQPCPVRKPTTLCTRPAVFPV